MTPRDGRAPRGAAAALVALLLAGCGVKGEPVSPTEAAAEAAERAEPVSEERLPRI